MIRHHALVFDDYISGSTPVYTGVPHMRALAGGDQIGLHAVLDNAGAACSVTVAIEHSTDGMNWSQKNTTAEISAVAVSTSSVTSVYGGETFPALQSLEFVRLQITITNGRGVHLKLYASVRDRTKGGFSVCECADGEQPTRRAGAHGAPSPREEVEAILANRPHHGLVELRRRLDEAPVDTPLRERMVDALAAMGEQERAELARFLGQVDRISPEARMEILKLGTKTFT